MTTEAKTPTLHTFTMTEDQATLIHRMTEDQIGALKNWALSAIEDGDLARAQRHAKQVREHQAIFAAFNMSAKHTIAEATGKKLVVAHTVRAA